MRKINQLGLELIKKFEGFSSEAYRDSAGVVTIGYGHTNATFPHAVMGMVISEQQAEDMLNADLAVFEAGISRLVNVPLTNNQFSALVAFSFNIGLGEDDSIHIKLGFKQSTLRKLLNQKDYSGASNEFPKWNKSAGEVLNGLTKRREAERELFLTP